MCFFSIGKEDAKRSFSYIQVQGLPSQFLALHHALFFYKERGCQEGISLTL